ncbi:MAG: hypothetical protein PHG51_06875, partial [Candidatus Omnitrophica bacterium]|nr:hypothetical protein [Candidatus Omnitrophota bacterium]
YNDVGAFRTIVIRDPPTALYLKDILKTTPEDTLPLPWTVDEIRNFAVYLPSVVNKLQENLGRKRLSALTGVNGTFYQDRILRAILQLQTELSQRIATMDSYIVQNRGVYKTFLNKIYVYNRITAMLIALGLLDRKDASFMSYHFSRDNPVDMLIGIKKKLIGYLELLPMTCVSEEKYVVSASLTTEEQKRYGYVNWLKENLGDNLRAIVLYGSAAREKSEFSDFDNWVVVKDLDAAYKVLKGVALTFKDGEAFVRGEEGKEVALNVIPEYIFPRISRFNTVCDRDIDRCKVLYGSVELYRIDCGEVIERSISSVYLRLKTLRTASLWIARRPQEILGKKALFEYFVKNTQFVMNICINYREGLRVVSKEEIKKRLAEIGIELFEYKDDPEYIAEAMIQTAVDSSKIHALYLKDRRPNFSFLDYAAIHPQVRQNMEQALVRRLIRPANRSGQVFSPLVIFLSLVFLAAGVLFYGHSFTLFPVGLMLGSVFTVKKFRSELRANTKLPVSEKDWQRILPQLKALNGLEIIQKDSNRIWILVREEGFSSRLAGKIDTLLSGTSIYWKKKADCLPWGYTCAFWVYPGINRKEFEAEIYPYDNTVVAIEGEWAVTNAYDENYKIASYGIHT